MRLGPHQLALRLIVCLIRFSLSPHWLSKPQVHHHAAEGSVTAGRDGHSGRARLEPCVWWHQAHHSSPKAPTISPTPQAEGWPPGRGLRGRVKASLLPQPSPLCHCHTGQTALQRTSVPAATARRRLSHSAPQRLSMRKPVQLATERLYNWPQNACTTGHRTPVKLATERLYNWPQNACTTGHRTPVQLATERLYN
ncbi:hypothetical protein ACOMHN_009532 [Nucella lapillus]